MTTTKRSEIPQEINNFYNKTLLLRAIPLFLHGMFAQTKDIPKNAGTNVIKFRRYSNLSPATTPLTESVTPTGSALSQTTITATVAQYGDFTTVSDVLTYESQDKVLMEAAEILGDQAGETLDILVRNILSAGTNVMYAGGRSARNQITSSDKITGVKLKQIVRQLKKANARKITRQVNASTGYSTEPVAASYVGFVSPDTVYDLYDITGFVKVEKYSSNMSVMEGEVGKFGDIRFIETNNAQVFSGGGSSGIDVHSTVIMGQEAYGVTRIQGHAMENIIKPLGAGNDPLNQRATSGWKATFVGKILNDAFLVRHEHAVSG